MTITPNQLETRRRGIGGSDAAAVLGLSKWATPLDIYLSKVEPVATRAPMTEPMLWGNLLEPVVRQRYSDLTGRAVTVPDTIRHPVHSFMIAHVDGVTDDGRLLEIKTAGSNYGWGEPGSDEIPGSYLIQVQHYLFVMDLPVADVAVLIGGCDFRQYEIPADPELQEMIVDGEREFWHRVETLDPPPIDLDNPRALEIVRRMYPGTDGTTVDADTDAQAWRTVLEQATARASDYQAAADGAKAHLLAVMGSAAQLRFNDGKALRRKLTTRKGYVVEPATYMDARLVNAKD